MKTPKTYFSWHQKKKSFRIRILVTGICIMAVLCSLTLMLLSESHEPSSSEKPRQSDQFSLIKPSNKILLLQAITIILVVCAAVVSVFLIFSNHDQKNLRKQAMKYRLLQRAASDITFEYDAGLDVFTYSRFDSNGIQEQFSIDDFLISQKYKKYIREDYLELFLKITGKLLAEPAIEMTELPLLLAEKGYTWNRISCQSITNSSNDVKSFIGAIVSIDDLVQARESAEKEASFDTLTGALSRKAFFERTQALYEDNNDSDSALIMVDIDNFKDTNDTFGHLEGDKKLTLVVSTLSQVFSADDLIGRYGGDEFMVFLQKISHETMEKRLKQFKRLIAEKQTLLNNEVTCSVGVIFADKTKLSFNQLVNQADEAMYQAKNTGKNRYVVLDAETWKSACLPEESNLPGFSQQSHTVQLRALLEYMDAGVVLMEVGNHVRMIYASKSYYTMNGEKPGNYEIPRIINKKMMYEDDVSLFTETLKDGVATGKAVECVYRSDEGGTIWRHLRAVRIPYVGSELPVLIGVITDVTKLKNGEARMRQYEYERGLYSFGITLAGIYDEIYELDYGSKAAIIRFSKLADHSEIGIAKPLDKLINLIISDVVTKNGVSENDPQSLQNLLKPEAIRRQKPFLQIEHHRRLPSGGKGLIQTTLLRMNRDKYLLCNLNISERENVMHEHDPHSAKLLSSVLTNSFEFILNISGNGKYKLILPESTPNDIFPNEGDFSEAAKDILGVNADKSLPATDISYSGISRCIAENNGHYQLVFSKGASQHIAEFFYAEDIESEIIMTVRALI